VFRGLYLRPDPDHRYRFIGGVVCYGICNVKAPWGFIFET
jgi:hypothetical protein